MTTPNDLAARFRQHFTLVPALDAALQRETYRIRHEVYCRDLGWEPVVPQGLETDDYDRHSMPCLLRAAETGAAVGCLRLVLCRPDDLAAPLPLERLCGNTLDAALMAAEGIDRGHLAEVSRLAVLRNFRRRKGEADKPVALESRDFGEGERQRFPFIPVSLYLGALAMALELQIEHLLLLTEPRMAEHLARIGVSIKQIGPPVEHRGLRIPSLMPTRSNITHLKPLLARMWEQIQQEVAAAFAAANAGLPGARGS